ncbi:hypothetical protein J4218_06170 [Candidatus Pacearchaeota archaeon]|nr:hypothetical protein [Candidatus Pacearchaeota archaeon]
MKSKLYSLIAAALIGISGCGGMTIDKKGDLTGDGIEDIVVSNQVVLRKDTYLFIGQKDGTYIRSTKYNGGQKDGPEYFMTDDNRTYFFDGKFYVEAKKDEGVERK